MRDHETPRWLKYALIGVAIAFIAGCFGENRPRASRKLEAILPVGRERDPFAIHHAQGITSIPNRSMVERLKGQVKLTPHDFEGITPKRAIEGVFMVAAKNFWPPDAAGTGPFFLVKEKDRYFVLTERNFADVYGPIDTEDEVLPYTRVFGALFLTAFGNLVITKEGHREGNATYYPAGSPEVTTVRKKYGGFAIRLVYYTGIHRACFYAVDVFLKSDGTLKKLGQKVLKDIGPGIVF
jgi:hypothetical protein